MSTEDMIEIIDALGKPKLAVMGDLILDHYVFGAVLRISPEAPIPVLHVRREEDRLGGAANVTFHSIPGREFTGVVDKIGITTDLEIPAADVPKPRFQRMRSAPVVGLQIRLQKPPPELVPGLSAVVAIRKAK